jgi:uncharacterized protein with HEPN domain
MLDAARDARGFCARRSRLDLDDDRLLALGLLKCLEIIGEAAARVEMESRAGAPRIPWTDIVGMRNRLVHAYYDIDLDQVWQTVTEDVPLLITELEQVLAASSSGGEAST